MSRFLEILFGFGPGELAGADGWRPTLVGIPESPWAILGLLVLLAALVWLTVRSYRREGTAPRGAKLALAALRVGVIVLVILMLLQPALRMRRVQTDYATVVVLVDDTLSMSLRDPYADAERRAELAALLDDGTEPTGATRSRIVQAMLARAGSPLAELAEDHSLAVFRFGAGGQGAVEPIDEPLPASPQEPTASDSAAPAAGRGAAGRYTEPILELVKLDPAQAPAGAEPPSRAHVVVPVALVVLAGAWLLWLMLRLAWATLFRRRVLDPQRPRGPSGFAIVSGAVCTLLVAVGAWYALRAHDLRQRMPAERVRREVLVQRDLSEQLSEAAARLTAGGFETDLARAVRDALDEVRGRRVSALVLISDGQPTREAAEETRLAAVRELLRERNIPLVAVGVGDEAPPRNLRVESLAIPPVLRRGSTVPVEVTLLSSHLRGTGVEVQLLRRGEADADFQPTGASASVTLEPDAAGDGGQDAFRETVARMQLEIDLEDGIGRYAYKAVVRPLPGEILDDDNEAIAHDVAVSDERIRVLLVSGDAGWEFQFLRNYLLSQPQKYLVSVWQQNAEMDFNQEASTPGMQLTTLPRTAEELVDRYDVVILYDPYYTVQKGSDGQEIPGGFDGPFVRLLETFVSVHRGGLAYIASNKYTRQNLVYGSAGEENVFEPLATMLPVALHRQGLSIAEQIAREDGVAWRLLLTPLGAEHPIMRLGATPEETRELWGLMPGIYWAYPVQRLKPAAVALAESSSHLGRTDDNQPLPLIATHMYGRGPVLYLGFDGAWRWRYVSDAAHYYRFWSNVVEYLATHRMLKKRVLVSVVGDRAGVGEAVRVKAEAYDAQFEPFQADRYVVQVTNRSTRESWQLPLRPDGKERGVFRGTFRPPTPGEYAFTAADVAGQQVAPDDVLSRTIQVTLPRDEFVRPEANPVVLASLSGEEAFLPAERFGELAEQVPPGRLQTVRETTRELWSVWVSVVLLCVLLAAEWIARKKYNMA